MLPERSSTNDVATVGFGMTLASIGTTNVSPLAGTSTVSVPDASVPAAPGSNITQTKTSCVP
jgi:hypothetical protein